jgi:hypothetical protein
VIWKRTYVDSSTYSEALSLADNGDNTYVFTGSSFWLNFNDAPSNGNHGNDDVLVVDVDDNGNKKWEKFFGGSNIDIAFNIQHARGGGSYITGGTGSTNGNVTGNHGNNDAWVIKIKQDGSLEWQKTFGGSGDDGSFAFSQLSDNNFVIGGTTGSTDADMTGYTRADNAMLIKAGAANIITGMVFIDNNNNHVKDGNEKFYNNVVVKSTKQSTDNASAVENGYYRNVADTGTYVTTVVPAAGYYTVFPATATSVFSSYAKTDTINFALLPIAGKNDLRVTLLPVTPARPGFNASYRMQYINAGTTVVNGTTIKLVKDHRVTLVSSSPAWATVTADTIVWNTGTINPLDTGYITLVAGIPAPPVTNIGDTLNFIATANPLVADETPADNTGILNQRAQGSFDPNDKIEVHGGNFVQVLSPNKEYLSYIIRFQNTGNDTAFAVNVTDTLEAKLDWSSFEMIAASHPYTVAINEGNKITWTFNNILLADSNHNEPASHGYIAFRIRPKADVAPGNVINNTASVYFDFNAPVKTNMQVTVVKPPSPQQPVTSAVSSGYCGTAAAQKVKIANIPAAAYQATVTVRLDNTTVLGVLADSTFSFSPSALAAGNHKIDVVFSNATAVRTTTLNFAITAAANPDVNVSANITTVVNLTSPVVLTAVNAAGGGTTPLYTFAKDRTFTNVLQAEGAVNNVSIQPNTLVVGSNWFYVRMKTSDTCFTSQTNIDSIKIERSSVTGLRDMDYPNRLINVYPNPFKQGININGLNTAKSYTISIHTAAGQQVYRQQVSNRATYSIDKLILPGGSYWLTIYDDKKHKAIGTTRLLRE